MKVRRENVDQYFVYIIDNAVNERDIGEFYETIINLKYRRHETSKHDDKFPIFSVDFESSRFEDETLIGAIARKLLKQFVTDGSYKLVRSYVNMSHYGDMEYPHRDCDVGQEDVTILYYANSEWNQSWGGETIFYEENDSKLAILPKPGRFAIFKGAIEHTGGVPNRDCSGSRLTLALKYEQT